MNSFDDDAMRYEKRSMVNDYLDQMKGTGFTRVIQSGPKWVVQNDKNGRSIKLKISSLRDFWSKMSGHK